MFTLKKKTFFLFIILITLSSFLRFYNLNWGAPFYFHPDERNIASSVSQLKFPAQMNPHFFAYGSLPIYTIYFARVIFNIISQLPTPNSQLFSVSFEQAILISRFFSAIFSVALIPLLFFIGKKIGGNKVAFMAAALSALSTGYIQFAHFGTFEMWLTILSVFLFLCTFYMLQRPTSIMIFLGAIIFGISIAAKISQLVLLPLPIFALALSQLYPLRKEHLFRRLIIFVRQSMLFVSLSLVIFFITNPFVILDYPSFAGSMKYESEVVLGTMRVFYTGEFVSSIPVVFQFLHIYPFLINPFLAILFIPSFFYVLSHAIKYKKKTRLFLIFYFLTLFLSQAFLYAKWTRYMMPTLPFIYLICSIAFTDLLGFISKRYKLSIISYSLLVLLIGVSFLFSISYFITAFIYEDTRSAAKNFAKQNIPPNASILSEVYDLGITPFNDSFYNITLYNFYDLDNNSAQYTPATLSDQLTASDYIILPSQRILKTGMQEVKKYPRAHIFYSSLLRQENGFQKTYETPCDLFCKITYLNNPIYSFEETVSVFDRPTVMIFKKM